ncbi:OLC1v1027857C1 [Oldenlandia corymbosa var. corymbosa]|uniref:OLC1v1027857C1 n=1 Tax=Oldenlandia corymbosa var. corymbosa TaxID=529605 RepID=A0AAV1CC77_OLDCO|nr:OLC1v1027857C1 [Oldenlandia corymbosa var. corymbosa]
MASDSTSLQDSSQNDSIVQRFLKICTVVREPWVKKWLVNSLGTFEFVTDVMIKIASEDKEWSEFAIMVDNLSREDLAFKQKQATVEALARLFGVIPVGVLNNKDIDLLFTALGNWFDADDDRSKVVALEALSSGFNYYFPQVPLDRTVMIQKFFKICSCVREPWFKRWLVNALGKYGFVTDVMIELASDEKEWAEFALMVENLRREDISLKQKQSTMEALACLLGVLVIGDMDNEDMNMILAEVICWIEKDDDILKTAALDALSNGVDILASAQVAVLDHAVMLALKATAENETTGVRCSGFKCLQSLTEECYSVVEPHKVAVIEQISSSLKSKDKEVVLGVIDLWNTISLETGVTELGMSLLPLLLEVLSGFVRERAITLRVHRCLLRFANLSYLTFTTSVRDYVTQANEKQKVASVWEAMGELMVELPELARCCNMIEEG